MADAEVNVALVALIVAALALLISASQLLQQVFGTADGYRRCQSSVIGDYATRTHRRWKRSEFRFETRYTTPFFTFNPMFTIIDGVITKSEGIGLRIKGNKKSRKATLSGKHARSDQQFDQVGWLLLLQNLHAIQKKWDRMLGLEQHSRANVTVVMQERSWDFIPPEIVKPLAPSTVGAIIAIAHRLGMRWFDIRPGDGVMRAEGGAGTLTSTLVRGLGIVFQYSGTVLEEDGTVYHDNSSLIFPSAAADLLGFGIITRSDTSLYLSSIPLMFCGPDDSVHAISSSLRKLGIGEPDSGINSPLLVQRKKWNNGLSDLPGLLMGNMMHDIRNLRHLMSPPKVPSLLQWKQFTPLSGKEGRICLAACLRQYVERQHDASSQLKSLLELVEKFADAHPAEWKGQKEESAFSANALNDLNEASDMVNRFLRQWYNRHFGGFPNMYRELVAVHIVAVAGLGEEASKKVSAGTARKADQYAIEEPCSPEKVECAQLYAESLGLIVDGMKKVGLDEPSEVEDAWWTMIFKGIWWNMFVIMDDPSPTPVYSSWVGSQIPVWIS